MVKNADRSTTEYDVKSIVTVFLWDMPVLVKKPCELLRIIERFRRGNLRPEDKIVVNVLKHRLLSFQGGSAIYERIFEERAPVVKKRRFTPPEELAVKLREKLKAGAIFTLHK